ncbi:hypothetical protein A3J41_03440 [candidate division TM6 bacterium RIFCSPHIGHO2_12_FULL_38_8]|nr:MAG: hypothetical protein A3J41_03440 [candidate division TM6 bacterium RIFCSPHIGHO2_12_FULL_38_8]
MKQKLSIFSLLLLGVSTLCSMDQETWKIAQEIWENKLRPAMQTQRETNAAARAAALRSFDPELFRVQVALAQLARSEGENPAHTLGQNSAHTLADTVKKKKPNLTVEIPDDLGKRSSNFESDWYYCARYVSTPPARVMTVVGIPELTVSGVPQRGICPLNPVDSAVVKKIAMVVGAASPDRSSSALNPSQGRISTQGPTPSPVPAGLFSE